MSVTLGNNVTSPLTRSHTDKHLSWPWSERCWVSKVDKNALNIEGSCWLTGNVSNEVYCDEWNLYFLYVWAKPQVMEETSFAIDNDNETIPSRKIILANKFSSLSLTSLSIQTNTFSIRHNKSSDEYNNHLLLFFQDHCLEVGGFDVAVQAMNVFQPVFINEDLPHLAFITPIVMLVSITHASSMSAFRLAIMKWRVHVQIIIMPSVTLPSMTCTATFVLKHKVRRTPTLLLREHGIFQLGSIIIDGKSAAAKLALLWLIMVRVKE